MILQNIHRLNLVTQPDQMKYIQPFDHLAKKGIIPIEMYCWRMCDKKLAAFGIVAG